MKRIFTALFVVVSAAMAMQADNVIFLKNQGEDTNDGLTPETAVRTMGTAINKLGDEGGTVVICGQYHQTANYKPSGTHTGLITITQEYNGTDYRESDGYWGLPKGVRFFLNGPTRFSNITFKQAATSNPFFLLIADSYPVTIDEGCQMTGTFVGSLITNSFTVLGGCQDNDDMRNPDSYNTDITINDGEVIIVGFNRGAQDKFSEKVAESTADIKINGGKIHNCFLGSTSSSSNISGNINLSIAGGEFCNKVFVGTDNGVSYVTGDVNVTVTGGNLSGWNTLYAPDKNENSHITLDITGAGESELMTLVNVRPDVFDEIKSNYKIPEKDFTVGEEFTASNGVTIPYRIHIPAISDNAPVVLFLHGLGSRGVDNVYQLSSMGAACLYPIYNYTEDAIIIAPQMPTTEQWVANDAYPGSEGFSVETPMSDYLTAANELLDNIVKKYSANEGRRYLAGSSNGAGAVWSLCACYPEKFAAAIPVAGTGDSVNASEIASALSHTPIWAFHGDKDEVLSPEGTRGLVAAIEKVDATNIKYTEVVGADHTSIWSRAATTPGLAGWMFDQINDKSTGIDDVTRPETSVFVGDGCIGADVDEHSILKVYDPAGRMLEAVEGDGMLKVSGMQPAVYIVSFKSNNVNKTVKVAVK